MQIVFFFEFTCYRLLPLQNPITLPFLTSSTKGTRVAHVKCLNNSSPPSKIVYKKEKISKVGKRGHHLWMRRDSATSGQKALNLVHIVSKLPNEKEAVYGALDKWMVWETECPLIAC